MYLDVREAGPAPLIAALGSELDIVKSINETIDWDEKQCQVDPGPHALAMIIDILLDRSPLYLVERNYRNQGKLCQIHRKHRGLLELIRPVGSVLLSGGGYDCHIR